MYHRALTRHLQALGRNQPIELSFVHPVEAVGFAAYNIFRGVDARVGNLISFSNGARSYASSIGLTSCLLEDATRTPTGPWSGKTYSPLTTLYTESEVDQCNDRICSVFEGRVSNSALRRRFSKIVGELHDNIASHASGRGYSACQIYQDWLHLAVGDAGCGLKKNGRKVDASVVCDRTAIEWAIKEGTSSAKKADVLIPPFSASDDDDEDVGNNHQGLGLYDLTSFVKEAGGNLWIHTGDCEFNFNQGRQAFETSPLHWSGLIIEVSIPIDAKIDSTFQSSNGEEFGL